MVEQLGAGGSASCSRPLGGDWRRRDRVPLYRWPHEGVVGQAKGAGNLELPAAETGNSQRRMPLPGVETYFVAVLAGRPVRFVAEELSTNLAKAMPRIIAEIEKVLGPERRFCVVFDRGGYDGMLFSWLVSQGVDFIT